MIRLRAMAMLLVAPVALLGPGVAQAATASGSGVGSPARPSLAARQRYDICLSQAKTAPEMAIDTANAWRIEGGGVAARHCLALAQMARGDYSAALKSFEAAAVAAEPANDGTAPELWAQAGNAALLAGQSDAAVTYLSTAIAEAAGSAKADPLIDRARAYVELDRTAEATADLDRAAAIAPGNVTALLLQATLARRTGDPDKAEAVIVAAAKLSPDNADVQLEAGNIAAAQGKPELAKAAWTAAAAGAPDSSAGKAAAKALAK